MDWMRLITLELEPSNKPFTTPVHTIGILFVGLKPLGSVMSITILPLVYEE